MTERDKRTVAVFDFDGTLTTRDTLLEFIKFSCGKRRFLLGFLLHAPLIVLMKLRLYSNGKAKQRVFAWFFKGMEYGQFAELGQRFASEVERMKRKETHELLKQFIREGATVYVVSASIDEWVKPYCLTLGVKAVLGTRIEVENGRLTGRFLTKNCYGQEKVNRLLEMEPHRADYCLYAYGDSRGDKELLAFADKGIYIQK